MPSHPHYYQRYAHTFYSPTNEARTIPGEPHTPWERERMIERVAGQVREAWEFGDWLYNFVLRDVPRQIEFDGTANSLHTLMRKGYIERSVRRFPAAMVRRACLIYSCHDDVSFHEWAVQARSIGVAAYCNWLSKQGCQPMRRRGPSALEREVSKHRKYSKPQRVKH